MNKRVWLTAFNSFFIEQYVWCANGYCGRCSGMDSGEGWLVTCGMKGQPVLVEPHPDEDVQENPEAALLAFCNNLEGSIDKDLTLPEEIAKLTSLRDHMSRGSSCERQGNQGQRGAAGEVESVQAEAEGERLEATSQGESWANGR